MNRLGKREVRVLVEGYKEGRRLMRHGDGVDEWYGMSIARENLLALVALGRNEEGEKVDRAELVECLRTHGLRDEARIVEASCARCGQSCAPGAYFCTDCGSEASRLLKGWSTGDKRLLILGVLFLIAAGVFAMVMR